MANYAVTTYQTKIGSLADVIAAMETNLETIVNTKTIRAYELVHVGGDAFVGLVVYYT